MKNVPLYLLLLLSLLRPAEASADVTFLSVSNGLGSFLFAGEDVKGVTGLDVSVDYDTSILALPSVMVKEGGSVTDIYAGTPGKLRFSVTRSDPSAQLYLMLHFQPKRGASPGQGINSITASVTGSVDPDQTSQAGSQELPKGGATSGDARARQPVSRPGPGDKDVKSGVAEGNAATLLFTDRVPSVAQRFLDYNGEKGLKAFTALFEQESHAGFVQEPAIALSDGSSPVAITIELQQEEKGSPDIALMDASLISLHWVDGNHWIVTVVPNEDAWDARLILKVGSAVMEVPILVAPHIEIDGDINEQNFLTALNGYRSGQAVARQWQHVPHLNDYIFTANYLVHRGNSAARQTSQ